jgi:AcrR family transcriptional regulator
MPYPSKLSRDALIQQAWTMIEDEGVANFSLHKLAAHFGVKTASLYRYGNKVELLRAVNAYTSERLLQALYPALHDESPVAERLRMIGQAYRSFALAHASTYSLMYTNVIDDLRPDEDELEQGVLPLQSLMADITGEAHAHQALRGLMALVHGFVMLENAQQFRRDGSLDEAFNYSLQAYLQGIQHMA